MNLKHFVLPLLMAFPEILTGQVQDDFSDGDFTMNPTWIGDTSHFEVNASRQLHLKSFGPDTSVLVTENSRLFQAEWNFWVKLSFNTSANNFARIYLASDVPDISSAVNGYFLQIGGAEDSLMLYRQNGNSFVPLIRGKTIFTGNSVNILRIRVLHDETGKWSLFADPLGGTDYREEGTAEDTQVQNTQWFGVFCKYTSSNSTKFYFDDFYAGPILVDTIPPGLVSVKVICEKILALQFSENIDEVQASDPSHYRTASGRVPSLAVPDSTAAGKVNLYFDEDFKEGQPDEIYVFSCMDLQGNISDTLHLPFCLYRAKQYDILIHEIMPDPDPSMGLPVREYVELFNRSQYPIELENWRFEWSSGEKTFPDVTLLPQEFLLLSKDTLLDAFGNNLALFSYATTLSNEGSTLVLKEISGKVIHTVTYSPEWFGDPFKAEGGWSLEMIDPWNPCGCSENWKASQHPMGGTPGSINSVHGSNPDIIQPVMTRAKMIDSAFAEIYFSESMDSLSLVNRENWVIGPEMGNPDSVFFIQPGFRSLGISLAAPIAKGKIGILNACAGPLDCAGNPIDTTISVKLAIPDTACPSDIVINELLFNPYPGGERFVEIFNVSEKVLDLKDLVVATLDSAGSEPGDIKSLTTDGYLFFPGQYAVLTTGPEDIQNHYTSAVPGAFLAMEALPSMNDKGGVLLLISKSNYKEIDRMTYSESMHFPLLTDPEGVSLERINPSGSSSDPGNWHSASENCGFATPGYLNSQAIPVETGEDPVSLSPQVFSPDNDGREDVARVLFYMEKPGFLVNVTVFYSRGEVTRYLARNRILASEDEVIWDGTDENRQKAAIGIYVVRVELFHPEGGTIRVKKALVLAGSF